MFQEDDGLSDVGHGKAAAAEAWASVCLLVLDVDGVLSDGNSYQDAKGRLRRCFSIRDAIGLRRWRKSGGRVAIVTSVKSAEVREEAEKLGADFFIEDCKDKKVALEWILKSEGISFSEIAFFGASYDDLGLFRDAGVSLASPTAPREIRAAASVTTKQAAGDGAVAEACAVLLRTQANMNGTRRTARTGSSKI